MQPNERPREDVIERVKKLLIKTEAAGCTQAEAEAAFKMASRIMAEHNLTMDEVDQAAPDAEEGWDEAPVGEASGRWNFEYSCAGDICNRFFFVERYRNITTKEVMERGRLVRKSFVRMTFFGKKSNVETARWVYLALLDAFDRLWNDYRVRQGQHSLNHCPSNNFQQELRAPTTLSAFHDEASTAGMLLQQREREAIEPRKILAQVLLPDARLVLAVGHVQAPVAGVLYAPVTPDRVRELLHAHIKTADVITCLNSLLSVAKARGIHHTDGLQALPPLPSGQALGNRHLDVTARLLTPMSGLAGLVPTRFASAKSCSACSSI